MLKTKNLNRLLTQNLSPQITSIFILTPQDGTLLAYSLQDPSTPSPTSAYPKSQATTLRSQATLAAAIWSAYTASTSSTSSSPSSTPLTTAAPASSSASRKGDVKHLTLELSNAPLTLHRLSSGLLLCLISPPPPASANNEPNASTTTDTRSASSASASASNPGLPSPSPDSRASGHLTEDASTGGDDEGAHSSLPNPDAPQLNGEGARASVGLRGDQLRTQAESLAGWLDKELGGFVLPVGS